MFKNHFRIALRTLAKNKVYALINVAGLALSLTCGILIFIFVKYHLGFDHFHADASRIYRFVTEGHRDNINYSASVPPPFGKTFRKDFPFGEAVANIASIGDEFITIDDGAAIKKFSEKNGVAFAEPAYFDIFNYPLLIGNKSSVLKEPNTAVITRNIAKKYFDSENPINKIIKLENRIPFTITGILADLPGNTDQKTEIYFSYSSLRLFNQWLASDDGWGGISSELQCFVKLRKGISPETVEKLLPDYAKKYRPKSRNLHVYKLQPLAEIHFDARYGGVIEKHNLWILSIIGIFIIITACVNFINLATAQAINRSKEVGVRKVLGSMRSQLFWQFIAETGLITLISVVLALSLARILLPSMNNLLNTQIAPSVFTSIPVFFFLLVLAILVTFFAGSYPGIILANFKPIAALKGKISGQQVGGVNTRRGLITIQFAISQILILGMLVIAFQMHYAKGSGLGFDKEAIVMVPMGRDSSAVSISTLRNKLSQIPGIERVAVCGVAPSSEENWTTSFKYDHNAEDELFSITVRAADDQYLPTFGLDLVAGRNIFPADSVREFVVNEAFVRKLNLRSAAEVLGKSLRMNGGSINGLICGVVRDFHDRSYHSDINAVCICSYRDNYQNFAVKLNVRNAKPVMMAVEKAWNEVYPNQIYDYHFLDEQIAAFYQAEGTILQLIQLFSFLAIFIGCLGLYGLTLFMAGQKTKEIGIRKVLGSSISQILWIFGKEFARLILIAFVIATPLAFWLMNKWLENFKFHIQLSPLFFLGTIVSTLLIATLTVWYQAAKAARRNPIESLRLE